MPKQYQAPRQYEAKLGRVMERLGVEIKGKVVKRLQRDYQLRRHLFALRYLLPNGWEFEEVAAEGLTGGSGAITRGGITHGP